jgi:hypothetical protein
MLIELHSKLVTNTNALFRLVFYYPLLGMINIFISILKASTAESASSKIGVMDMAAGYFAYLDYSTGSTFSFALVRNLAQWARQAVSRTAAKVNNEEVPLYSGTNAEEVLAMQHDYTASMFEVRTL